MSFSLISRKEKPWIWFFCTPFAPLLTKANRSVHPCAPPPPYKSTPVFVRKDLCSKCWSSPCIFQVVVSQPINLKLSYYCLYLHRHTPFTIIRETHPLGLASSSFNTVRSQNSNTIWSFLFRRNTSNKFTRFGCFSCYKKMCIAYNKQHFPYNEYCSTHLS